MPLAPSFTLQPLPGPIADTCLLLSSSVEVSVFKYQPGLQTPVEQLHNYRISSRGAAITGSLTQTEERRGENVSGSVDIAAGTIELVLIHEVRVRLSKYRTHLAKMSFVQILVPQLLFV